MASESNLQTGDQRTITANAPATGYQFAGWTGDTSYLADPTQPVTIVTIGSANVTVTATYSLIPVSGPPTTYVSLTGSDTTGTGTQALPWRTPAKAFASTLTAGWRIMIMNGTYAFSTLLPLAPGVSVEGESRTGVILLSSYAASNTDETDGSIQLKSTSYIDGNQTISNLTLSGNSLTSKRGIAITYRNNVVIHDCTIVDFKYSGIWFKGSNKAWDIEPAPYCTGNAVYNCTINNCAVRDFNVTPMPGSASLRINGQDGFYVRDCTFTQNTRQSAPTGENNNGNILGGEWFKNLKIYRCTFTKRDAEPTWNFFMELWRWMGGGEIYDCNFYGAACVDIVDVYKGTAAHGIDIYNNNFYTASGTIVADPQEGQYSINLETKFRLDYCYIYDNYFKNVPNCIEVDWRVYTNESVGLTSMSSTQIHIYRNVMENVGSTNTSREQISIEAAGTDPNITVSHVYVRNNTIKSNTTHKAQCGINLVVFGNYSYIYYQNNIIVGCVYPIEVKSNTGQTPANMNTLVIQTNLYYACTTNSVNFVAGVTYTPAYVNTGQLVSDPLLTSATDYHLLANSPCVDSGTNVGLPYLGNAPDRGAYESTGTVPTSSIYYVSQSTGSDSNAGTSSNTPWKTIAKVNASTFASGSQILFMCGDTWAETLTIPSSGVAGSPITFSNYGTGAIPVITGSSTRANTINTNDKSWITIDGFTLAYAQGTTIDDGSLSIGPSYVTGIIVKNCAISNNRRCGIICKGSVSATDVEIHNTIINNNGAFGIYVWSAYTTLGVIRNNQIYSNGVHSLTDAQQVSNIYGNLSNFRVYQNTIYDAAPGTASGNTICHGIYHFSPNIGYASIYQNTIYGNLNGMGIRCKHNAHIYSNLMYGNRHENIQLGDNGAYSATYNVYYNVLKAGVLGYEGVVENTKGTGELRLYVYNNTFYKNGFAFSSSKEINIVDDLTEVKIKNNLFYAADAHGSMKIGSQTHLACDYNLFWKDTESGVPNIVYSGVTYATLAAWQTAYPAFDPHSLNVNPLLVSPPTNVHLQDTSPCINAGFDVGYTEDFDGVTLSGAPDIGAYENVVGGGTPTASTYFVSSSTGSDSNSGQTELSPWATLAKVNATAFPAGSSVLFKKGDSWNCATTATQNLIPRSGSSAGRVTYGAYGVTGADPMIHASLTNATWVDQGGGIWRTSITYTRECGNILMNESSTPVCGYRRWSTAACVNQGDWYHSMSTSSTTNTQIYMRSSTNPSSYYTSVRLIFVVMLCYMNTKSYINIRNLNFSYTGYNGIQLQRATQIQIYDCELKWIGGISFNAPTRAGNGIEIWCDGGATSSDITVEYCTIGQCFDAGISNQGDVGTQHTLVYRKNLVYDCEYSYEYFMELGSTVYNIRFENNTCVNAGGGWGHTQRTDPTGRHIRIARTPLSTDGFVIRNNIFYQSTETLNYTREIENNIADFTFNYNLYYNTVGPNIATIMLTPYTTFAAYRAAYPMWEANSVNANPLFTNAGAGDYTLASGSPAINAGLYVGLSYNGSAPDMGCFESADVVLDAYYVASNGSDSNNGTTSSTPWLTLAKVNATTLVAGKNILFRRGDTFYGSLTVNVSGSAGSPITFGAYGVGADPIITGFTTVSAWTNVGSNIWESTSAVSALSTCYVVSVNDVNTPMGRFPNATNVVGQNKGYLVRDTSPSNYTSITNAQLAGVNWTGAEVVTRTHHTSIDRSIISSQSGSTITFPSIASLGEKAGFFIQKDIRCLTVQDEWYYNTSTKKISVYNTIQPTNVKVPSIETLLTVNGSYITFDGLKFHGSNTTTINKTSTSTTSNLQFKNCEIAYSGYHGLNLNLVNTLLIDNCTIRDVSGCGTILNNLTQGTFTNNTLYNIGIVIGADRDGGSYAGMLFSTVDGLLLQYNHLYNLSNNGFNIGSASNQAHNVQVRNNIVDNCNLVLSDGAAITGHSYTNWVIDGNIVMNGYGAPEGTWDGELGPRYSAGIYLDYGSLNCVISNNSVYDFPWIGIYLQTDDYITVTGNTTYNNQNGLYIQTYLSNQYNTIVTNNKFVSRTIDENAAQYRSNAETTFHNISQASGNCYARPIANTTMIRLVTTSSATNITLAAWQSYSGLDLNSTTSPFTVASDSDLRFEYNATQVAVTRSLGENYRDLNNVNYTSITLQPYTSIVLMKHAV